MDAAKFIEKSTSPATWRAHSRALRHSADVLWADFVELVAQAAALAKERGERIDLASAMEGLETTKLLYGLALETALKAWLVEHAPDKIEIRLTTTGDGTPTQAELRSFGVPAGQGHNILGLAEAAGVFGPRFAHVLPSEDDIAAVKNICRDLGEVVVWRGRYPVPMTSYDPVRLDPKVPALAVAHYIRDWLDPLLDALLQPTQPAPAHSPGGADA